MEVDWSWNCRSGPKSEVVSKLKMGRDWVWPLSLIDSSIAGFEGMALWVNA